ncbi:MAG: VanZ family protein [Lachnospiraceae bacterium]|nr:VanZ family protein [Lachnospiraceae bacterium]
MNRKRWKLAGWIAFFIYLVALMYFLLFAEMFGRTQTDRTYRYNLVLLKEIWRFWHYREQLGMTAVLLNLVGNVVALMPFGFFLPFLAVRTRKCYAVTCFTFLFSLFIETTQLLCKVGSFDVDDLLLNTIGGILGYFFFWVGRHIWKGERV